MPGSVSASRLAGLVEGFGRSPAYAGLAEALTLPIGDGRIPLDTRLPSERELSQALSVSRTTVTRAYAALVESGYARAKQGAGTFTRVPGGLTRAHDKTLTPGVSGVDAIDLNCAAGTAPPGVAAAYTAALEELPAHLGGHGYFPAGVPELQEAIAATYTARGLSTRPDQVMVTTGSLSGAAIVAQALSGPGDRVLVESPVYPNAVDAIRHSGARLVPAVVDADALDLPAVEDTIRHSAPKLAYLIPDFQNPTGHLMSDPQREHLAGVLRETDTIPVIDEAHQALLLDGGEMPAPFASYSPDAITLGSASKSFWGGLRLGWIRMPEAMRDPLERARLRLDLGAPVFEQLALRHLLADSESVLTAQRARLRAQREALVQAVRTQLPDWTFRVPSGGLALWCRLPYGSATRLVEEGERRGVVVAPGPVFAAEGGLDRFVRVPWTRPAEELRAAVTLLAEAWELVRSAPPPSRRSRTRVMVA
ncbi:PLP-dependent aminotransferase family protein [Nocardioides insulae]|uniref:MocR-like transcription factor YczR n=1 Tax=Nocardioides insulae TaxID=394734 RepID=UPI000406316D|nr:PLP-dependent aminotransferase family protein [Nocardioides insulae]